MCTQMNWNSKTTELSVMQKCLTRVVIKEYFETCACIFNVAMWIISTCRWTTLTDECSFILFWLNEATKKKYFHLKLSFKKQQMINNIFIFKPKQASRMPLSWQSMEIPLSLYSTEKQERLLNITPVHTYVEFEHWIKSLLVLSFLQGRDSKTKRSSVRL